MAKKAQFIDDYSRHAYDEEDDLRRGNLWIHNDRMTPAGRPWTPMFDWMWQKHVDWGVFKAYEELSIPTGKGVRDRSYHGYHFVTISVPHSDEEKKERSERYGEGIRPLLENFPKLWEDTKSELLCDYEKYKRYDYDKATWLDLAQLIKDWEQLIDKHWYLHMYYMVGLGTIYREWENITRDLLGIDDTKPEFHKLITGFYNRNFDVDKGIFSLLQQARELGLQDVILSNKPEEVVTKLGDIESGKQWLAKFHDYLDEFGWRCPDPDELTRPSWIEDPTPVIRAIQAFLEKGVTKFEVDSIIDKQTEERKQAEQDILSRLPLDKREWYQILMKVGQQASAWMEDHTFYFEFAFHSVTRHFLLHVGKRLAEAGAIEQADDIFFLVPDEVLKLIYDPYKFSAQARVAMRKAQWEEAKKLVPELFMTSIPMEEGLKEVAESQDIICGKTGTSGISEPKPELKADLIGETGSSGSAEGPARVILSVDQMWEIQPGEILVTAGTDSTWTPVFSLIKGLVADSGGSLSHAAIIGREYGIPVVINTNKAVRTIKTGQWIKIDADLGAVWIKK